MSNSSSPVKSNNAGTLRQGDTNKVIELRIPLNMGIAGHVATTSQSLNIPDTYNHPLFNNFLQKLYKYLIRQWSAR